MTSIRRNIVANYAGQLWTGLLTFLFVPVYIGYLGLESYGLIGVYAVLQACLSFLDLGMTPTLTREMARYTAGQHTAHSIRELLRSIELIGGAIALGIAILVGLGAHALAHGWVVLEALPAGVVRDAIALMGGVIGLRLLEGVYRGSLYGLQHQVWFNAVYAVLAALRHIGVIAVLHWFSPTITTFFAWQFAASLLSVGVLAWGVHHRLPAVAERVAFSAAAVSSVRQFAGSMLGISALSLLLTQVDKILLSRLLPLSTFAHYSLAASLAGILYFAVTPIAQALYPRMIELSTGADPGRLVGLYHLGAQLVSTLASPVLVVFCLFPEGVIFGWSGSPALAVGAAPILVAIAVGTYLNGLMWIPYHCQLAHGWTSLTLKINIGAVVLLVPLLFVLTPRFGAVAAAWVWTALNLGYVIVNIQIMHRRLLPGEKWRWYLRDTLVPLAGAVALAVAARWFQPAPFAGRGHWVGFLAVTGGLAAMAAALVADRVRPAALRVVSG